MKMYADFILRIQQLSVIVEEKETFVSLLRFLEMRRYL